MLRRTEARTATASSLFGRTTMFVTYILAKVQAYRRYRKIVRELSVLPDQALRDIGISRGDIADAALDYANP
jgi:uncharacterized protein YjiS (DUF1127 family)